MRHLRARRRDVLWLVAVAAVILPAAAQAATPFNIGNGVHPTVTIDSAGNGYFAWLEHRGDNDVNPAQVHFCKVLVGASTCAIGSQFAAPGIGGRGDGEPQVFLKPNGQPTIVTGCSGCFGGSTRTSQFVSSDGGKSFQPRPGYEPLGLIGGAYPSNQGDYDPAADAFFGIWGGDFQRMPLTPATVSPVALSPFSGGSMLESAVTFIGSGATQTHVAVFSGSGANGPEIRFKHHTNPSDINTPGNWNGGDTAIAKAQHISLATGPGGIVLLSARDISPVGVEARVYSAATNSFGPGVTVTSEAQGDKGIRLVAVHQATNGRLHAVWQQTQSSASVPVGARYATSADGVTWSAPQSIVADANMNYPTIAGTTDPNKGWIVYANDSSSDNAIRVATLDPLPIAASQPVPPAPPPPPPPAPLSPGLSGSSAARKAITVSDKYASYSFSVPKSCVSPGQSFTATLTWKRKKRKGNVFVKVSRVDFYLDSKRLTIDRAAPFAYRYKVVAGERSGSTIKLRARAFTKVRRGKAPTKSLRATVTVC